MSKRASVNEPTNEKDLMVESYCHSKGLKCRQPFPGFYVIDIFDEHIKLSSKTLLKELDDRVPSRGSGDNIVPGQLQWVQGSNRNLMFRGNELNRRKIWAQNGAVKDGVRIYVYTGFAYPVAEATSDWNDDETFKNASEGMNTFMNAIEAPEMNHLIVTAYDNGDSNIGMHYDKMKSLHPKTMIAVLKIGEHGRPFAVRKRLLHTSANPSEQEKKELLKAQEKEPLIFNEIVPPGTLLLMTAEANLATQHGVPVVDDVGLSGSIVWRHVTKVEPPSELKKKVDKCESTREKRELSKRKREDEKE
jgi:hypothetical protein